ncbi:MAG: selenocysteine-specific translation elongation factor [Bryobacteraceae bacterium]|nr:selenocysteine-specific translation elongation factor [Bryobacteraceae bacterium]MDW8377969.1 selenocysteine-specific translation elongation factor [Bryobacterales bacterium]
MLHCIVGTAGHIDHGKTALVRALTGIDTDRLKEEKQRGISIDLGFADLALAPDIHCAFIDVPGHERFVKNMLAGVAGIDIVLLVISAEESIKPQTREHFDICRLLGLRRGIIALTKTDLVDAEMIELVRLEVEDFVRGSFLEGAPVVPVSSVTGAGLEQLKCELAKLARNLPPRPTDQHFRLPVDRSFTIKGFGAVVTGTITGGQLKPEDDVELHPLGLKLRVRGVQVHGRTVPRAVAGQRAAVNLVGIDHQQVRRGMTLTAVGAFADTKLVDCLIELLPSARPLKHRAPVHFHAGTAEIEAEIRLMDRNEVKPGERAYARLALRQPVLLLPGDRFILRQFSPVVTIAGGEILDLAPPRKLKGGQQRLKILETSDPTERVKLFLAESACGMSLRDLIARTGLSERALKDALSLSGVIWLEAQQWAVSLDWFRQAQQKTRQALAVFHQQNPLKPGLNREELRSREFPQVPAFLLDAVWNSSPDIAAEGELLRLSTHKLALKQEEENALRKIEDAFRLAALTVPSAQQVLQSCGVDSARARNLLQILIREKRVVKVSDDLLFHPSALSSLRQILSVHKGQRFTVAEFKQWTGVSRKYAIPLLEYLDRERITRREGDLRIVL